MADPLTTQQMQQCIDAWRAGDRAAADELLRAAADRLEHLARRMLRGFPTVRRHADTADVFQGGSMRLLSALRDLRPGSTRDFFNLAAVQMRRELLDLARHFGVAGRAPGVPMGGTDEYVPRDTAPPPAELELWCRFHEAVEGLPAEEREVVGLIFYHGRTRPQVAEVLGVSERTVHRRWQSACLRLNERLGGELPPT